jgi:hypothetical protein
MVGVDIMNWMGGRMQPNASGFVLDRGALKVLVVDRYSEAANKTFPFCYLYLYYTFSNYGFYYFDSRDICWNVCA